MIVFLSSSIFYSFVIIAPILKKYINESSLFFSLLFIARSSLETCDYLPVKK